MNIDEIRELDDAAIAMVAWLDSHLLDMSHEQDQNLAYVITTRSQNKLTLLDSSSIIW